MPARSIHILGSAAEIPSERVPTSTIVEAERERYEAQLGALSPAVRARLESQLGIEAIRCHSGVPSRLASIAAARALRAAGVDAGQIDALIDCSTMAGDHPGIAALANQIQAELGATRAVPFAVQGSGCAGLLVAMRVACSWLQDRGGPVLLFGADCVPSGSRCSLPISIMGDAASAIVLDLAPPVGRAHYVLRAVTTTTLGVHHALVHAANHPPRIEVDAAAFEQRILPLHFVMCERVLTRALAEAERPRSSVTHVVYPNTTALDRASVGRALGFVPEQLTGPGPRDLGHAFANDLLINLPDPAVLPPSSMVAMLAVGSGFTWGAALFEVEPGQ